MQTDNSATSYGWICRVKDHGLVHKKLAGGNTAVYTDARDLWCERLSMLLEGYEPQDIYNTDEMGSFSNCFPDRTLTLKGQSCHGGKCKTKRILCENRDDSDKQVPTVVGKSVKPRCLNTLKTSCEVLCKYKSTDDYEYFHRDFNGTRCLHGCAK
jgi:hypothetical protein